MATEQTMAQCARCQQQTVHFRQGTSHILHLLLSVVSFGVWIIAWIIIAISHHLDSKCSVCGRTRWT